jgi:hypothetical protein
MAVEKRGQCSDTSFYTIDRVLFLHCIIKLGNKNHGSKIPQNMDIVSLDTCLLDF